MKKMPAGRRRINYKIDGKLITDGFHLLLDEAIDRNQSIDKETFFKIIVIIENSIYFPKEVKNQEEEMKNTLKGIKNKLWNSKDLNLKKTNTDLEKDEELDDLDKEIQRLKEM